MKPGRCQPKPGIYPVVSYISAPRGWSFYKHMPITEDCGPEIVLNKSEIPHVAMSLTMNIFEPPNSSIPEKNTSTGIGPLILVAHPEKSQWCEVCSQKNHLENPSKSAWNFPGNPQTSQKAYLIVLQKICQTRLQHTGWRFRGELLVTPPAGWTLAGDGDLPSGYGKKYEKSPLFIGKSWYFFMNHLKIWPLFIHFP